MEQCYLLMKGLKYKHEKDSKRARYSIGNHFIKLCESFNFGTVFGILSMNFSKSSLEYKSHHSELILELWLYSAV